ncbi:MAG TPA: hypothetical protein HA256_08830 [Methanoregulaceae archaeon]|nr:hypothetical protein [Methanoregulaceae archaeon]
MTAIGKGTYLKSLTAVYPLPSIPVGKTLEGSSPPSVFIGSWNYPKVSAGPMLVPAQGDIRVMDTPESWIPAGLTQEEIAGYRMSMVRGKALQDVRDLSGKFAEQLREIALSSGSLESEAVFSEAPRGRSLGEEHSAFGPSAGLDRFQVEASRWEPRLERVYHDTDLLAGDALVDLHAAGIPFSMIQKAFSAGCMGRQSRRRFVPTRWSITACDTTIADTLLERVRQNTVIDTFRVHEFGSLHNQYAVILMPTPWEYEWIEAFLHIAGEEEHIFSDYEENRGKKGYSRVGGCYYSCKMAVLEALSAEERQAGAIVLREAHQGYVPMGVFNVRENVRHAMRQPPRLFEDFRSALGHVAQNMQLPVSRFIRESSLLSSSCRQRQMRLSDF